MYLTVKQTSMRYPAFSESSLRDLIHNEHKNGFSCCVFRPPGMRKVLIYIPSFEAWIRKNHESSDTYTKRTPDSEKTDNSDLLN